MCGLYASVWGVIIVRFLCVYVLDDCVYVVCLWRVVKVCFL